MCGIGGILFAEKKLEQDLRLLHSKLAHRGPDADGVWIRGRHALCHHSLSLFNQEGRSQPFSDPSGRYILVYNGQIYNYQELKEELSSFYRFTTRLDTEVVLAAYIIWGSAALDRLNGMFAFFIWDTVEEKGFAARDPLGIKPFVYAYLDQTLYFASELKALRALFPSFSINEEELHTYLVTPYLSGTGPNAIFTNIHYLEPGTFLHLSQSGLTLTSYYSYERKQTSLDEASLAKEIGNLLHQSVQRHLQADFPVGLFLSGGLDSSLIAAMAACKPPAFSIAFLDHEQIVRAPNSIVHSDDLPYAEQLARLLDLPFHKVSGSFASLKTVLQELASINDRIPAWEQELSQYALAKAASRHVKAVLVGDAADETHYGYYFILEQKGLSSLIQRFGGERRKRLLKHFVEKNLSLESITMKWLERLLHNGDIHTMHHGLEARVPFACRNLLAYSSMVPPEWGFKGGEEKALLRQSAGPWLSPSFAKRKKSAFATDPRRGIYYRDLLREEITKRSDFVDTYFHRDALLELAAGPVIDESDRMICFNLLSFFYWSDVYA